ncbi:TauD/TfdA family dioxygenase [Nocardiopsis sp. CNT312]|uniref:TauD/TfdA family dioxygenase n=1 Tax=Nocardiopsis sp. CNT312 TaxID=1137268 RepID=UPI002100FA31|nr:TauD/TfdA family dioxygenase [Nocardiopsis sp. CNT312]
MYETTPPATAGTDSLFSRHLFDLSRNDLHRRLVPALAETGLATFDGIPDRAAFAGLARELVALYPHPDGDPDGLTLLHAREAEGNPGTGRRGFTDSELLPHTERSCTPTPPRLLMLMCLTPADHGGRTLLTDGRAVAEDLAHTEPETWRVLSSPRTAYFGGSTGHAGTIFEPTGTDQWTIRLRLDELVRFAPRAIPHLAILRKVIDRHVTSLRLDSGQGFVLDNTRWLHGRHAFQGPRVMLRALGEPRPSLPLDRGFRVHLPDLELTTRNE